MEINLKLMSDDTVKIEKLEIRYPYSISQQNFKKKIYWQDDSCPIDHENLTNTNNTNTPNIVVSIRRKMIVNIAGSDDPGLHGVNDEIDSNMLFNEKIFAIIHWDSKYNRYVIKPRIFELPNYLFVNDLKKANETILFTLYQNGSEYKYSTDNKAVSLKFFMNISDRQ